MVPVSIVDAKTNMPSMVLGFRNSIVVIVEQIISADLHPMGNQMCHSDEENCGHSTGKTVKMSMAFVTLELSISFFCLPTYPDILMPCSAGSTFFSSLYKTVQQMARVLMLEEMIHVLDVLEQFLK